MKIIFLLLFILIPYLSHAYVFNSKATNYIAMDYNSGTVIIEDEPDAKMFPSSMSKLMTLYIIFSKLKEGVIALDDLYTVSIEAWKRGGSSMFLEPKQRVTILDLLRGVIIVSGNDAAITLAEGYAGSEENFIIEMNRVAKNIGLTNSHFVNSTGWPDAEHVMSARDLLTLSIRLFEDFPEYYHLLSEKEFTYNKIRQPNTNELLWSNLGVDGLKTGSTSAGGFGVVFSSTKDDRRIFAVMNGLESKKERSAEGEKLIKYIYNNFDNKTIFKANQEISSIKVLMGAKTTIPLVLHDDITINYERGREKEIKASISHNDVIKAPIMKGQVLGNVKIYVPNQEIKEVPVYAKNTVEEVSFIRSIVRKIRWLIFG